MPRKRHAFEEQVKSRFPDLARELAQELTQERESGQPVIDEQTFRTGALRVTVLWDKWDRVPPEDRSLTILRAYELAEGKESRERITLPLGMTVPEAAASGLLPFQIIPALRKGDPVTAEQCRDALLAEGASALVDPDRPQLRFATEEEAEAGRVRLSSRLPGSDPVWVITRDVGPVEEWTEPE
jgi:hypothetical protein